ncbi:MAG: membrane dipeptidase, partial [Mycobacteriaceae bacterium]|nr:membrane dipeptidase [Mycobacteriaceae bacterium]
AQAIHAATLVLDSHIDIPWPPETGGAFREPTRRCVDLPKMRAGGVSAGCFAAFVPQGVLDPPGFDAAWTRAQAMLQAICAMGGEETRVCTHSADVLEAWRQRLPAVLPCLENGYALGTDLSRIAQLRALGGIYVTLTHNGHNQLADSAVPRQDLGDPPARHGGLSALGREAIAAMNQVGLMIDVAHLSRDGMMQAAEASRTPVVSTHSCLKALSDHPRNLDDAQLDVLRDVGGVVQITAVPAFVRRGVRTEQSRLLICSTTSTTPCAESASLTSASARISMAGAEWTAGATAPTA